MKKALRAADIIAIPISALLIASLVVIAPKALGYGSKPCPATRLGADIDFEATYRRENASGWRALAQTKAFVSRLEQPVRYQTLQAALSARGFTCRLVDLTAAPERRIALESVQSGALHGGSCTATHPVSCDDGEFYWAYFPPQPRRTLSIGYTLRKGTDVVDSTSVAFIDPVIP